MTSKEALQYIITQIEGNYYDDCTCLEDEDLKAINVIKEDLEILDILRKHLYVAPELVELKMTGKEYATIHNVKYHNGIPIVVDRETFDKINKWFDERGRRND